MLTSKQRAILRGKANTMDPVFIVGKGEIDETMIQGVKDCLDARELIKLKVLESSMYNAREASVKLAEATGADCVQVIGSKFVLYLQKKKDSAYADLLKRGSCCTSAPLIRPTTATWIICAPPLPGCARTGWW